MQLKIEMNLQKGVMLVLPVSYAVVSESTSFQILKHNFAIA
jgi:hypothetical protein